MLGDMLLDANHSQEALAEYGATLKTNPGRFNSLYGAAQASEKVGNHDKASDYYSQIVKNCAGSVSERSELKHAREVTEIRAGNK